MEGRLSNITASSMRDRPLKLMLIDDDPIFRLGLRVWLNQWADLDVSWETGDGTAALQQLATPLGSTPGRCLAEELNLVILALSLGQSNPALMQGLNLCRDIRRQYPTLPVLLLSSRVEPLILAAAQQMGAVGVCLKTVAPEELERIMRQVAISPDSETSVTERPFFVIGPVQEPRSGAPSTSLERTAPPPGWWTSARRNLRLLGLRQIQTTLREVTEQLQMSDLSLLDRAILAGRHRELRAAQWIVQQVLATPNLSSSPLSPASIPEAAREIEPPSGELMRRDRPLEVALPLPLQDSLLEERQLQTLLIDRILAKLHSGLSNFTDTPLEIDILRLDRKQELFYLILRKFEDLLQELRFSQIQPAQLREKRSLILVDLWEAVATEFFGKYYTVTLPSGAVEVVAVLLQDAVIVQEAILDKIPLIPELLAHVLMQMPLLVDSTPYAVGNPESLSRAENILDNLLIQTANAVLQPLLNHFATVEGIKQTFYDRRLISNRAIEQLRNNLSWYYRLNRYVGEPRDIFESQYRLWVLQGGGIQHLTIYAPRTEELTQLTGVQYAVTLTLEARDAIVPRLQTAFLILGRGVVYVLTEVIGRGIGLIGQGILKGIGSVWQDSRYSRPGK